MIVSNWLCRLRTTGAPPLSVLLISIFHRGDRSLLNWCAVSYHKCCRLFLSIPKASYPLIIKRGNWKSTRFIRGSIGIHHLSMLCIFQHAMLDYRRVMRMNIIFPSCCRMQLGHIPRAVNSNVKPIIKPRIGKISQFS